MLQYSALSSNLAPVQSRVMLVLQSSCGHVLGTVFCITARKYSATHVQPDGDGLGAETALFHYLKRARKSVRVYNPDSVPKRYRFLDPEGAFLLGPGEVELWDQCDLWIIVDTNDPRRLGKVWNEMQLRALASYFFFRILNLMGF